jgi:hypothetical protein
MSLKEALLAAALFISTSSTAMAQLPYVPYSYNGYSPYGATNRSYPSARSIRHTLALCIAFVLSIVIATSSDAGTPGSIKFSGYPAPRQLFGAAWWIFGDGVIDHGFTERLENFLVTNGIPSSSFLFLNSYGGNLLEAMKLGRLIREHGLFAEIGMRGNKFLETAPGECYSACALAFLGGAYRISSPGSIYGLHRFYAPARSNLGSDVAQILSASVVQYIRDMGVDPALFTLMTEAGPGEIIRLSGSTQVKLNVVNNGYGPTVWSIESILGGIYLKGARETWHGMNKFLLLCAQDGIFMEIFYGGGVFGSYIIRHFTAHTLFLDDDEIPITNLLIGKPILRANNGVVSATYRTTDSIITRIAVAKTIGIAMKPPHTTEPILKGVIDMPFGDGAKKLPVFLSVCGALTR